MPTKKSSRYTPAQRRRRETPAEVQAHIDLLAADVGAWFEFSEADCDACGIKETATGRDRRTDEEFTYVAYRLNGRRRLRWALAAGARELGVKLEAHKSDDGRGLVARFVNV